MCIHHDSLSWQPRGTIIAVKKLFNFAHMLLQNKNFLVWDQLPVTKINLCIQSIYVRSLTVLLRPIYDG